MEASIDSVSIFLDQWKDDTHPRIQRLFCRQQFCFENEIPSLNSQFYPLLPSRFKDRIIIIDC